MALVVYWQTLAPTLGHGHDTGELTVVAALHGVAHPPGYPLYARIGWIWCQLLPGANQAWKMNLFSALCVAGAAGFLCDLIFRQLRSLGPHLKGEAVSEGDSVASILGGLLFAFSYSAWSQAVAAEVFGLHLLLLSLLGWTAGRWLELESESASRRWPMLGVAMLFGLGAAHHHTLVLAAPALLITAWLRERRLAKWGLSVWMAPAFLLVCLPFYYDLLKTAQNNPLMNWGAPDTVEKMWGHFLRKAYGTMQLSASLGVQGSGEAHSLGYWISLCRRQIPFPIVSLALFSFWFPPPKLRPLIVLLVGWALSFGPGFSLLGQQQADEFHLDMQERFYASSYWAVAALCGLGVGLALRWRLPSLERFRSAILVALSLLPSISIYSHWSLCSQAGQYQAYDTMKAMLDACPSDALLVVGGDLPAGACDYLQQIERFRPDIITVFPGLIGAQWHYNRLPISLSQELPVLGGTHDDILRMLCQAQIKRGGTVWSNQPLPVSGSNLRLGLLYQWVPKLASELSSKEHQDHLERQRKCLQQMIKAPLRGELQIKTRTNFWESYHLGIWHNSYRDLTKSLFRDYPAEALRAMDEQFKLQPATAIEQLNHGLLQLQLEHLVEAEQDFKASLALEPDYIYALAALVDLCRATQRPREAQYWQSLLRVAQQNSKRSNP